MDATPVLERAARAMEEVGLEAVLIGNAAAALRGAPVTTIDVDFFFQKSPATVAKLKLLAKKWKGVLLRPHYPVSGLYRISLEEEGCSSTLCRRSTVPVRTTVCEAAPGGSRSAAAACGSRRWPIS